MLLLFSRIYMKKGGSRGRKPRSVSQEDHVNDCDIGQCLRRDSQRLHTCLSPSLQRKRDKSQLEVTRFRVCISAVVARGLS